MHYGLSRMKLVKYSWLLNFEERNCSEGVREVGKRYAEIPGKMSEAQCDGLAFKMSLLE